MKQFGFVDLRTVCLFRMVNSTKIIWQNVLKDFRVQTNQTLCQTDSPTFRTRAFPPVFFVLNAFYFRRFPKIDFPIMQTRLRHDFLQSQSFNSEVQFGVYQRLNGVRMVKNNCEKKFIFLVLVLKFCSRWKSILWKTENRLVLIVTAISIFGSLCFLIGLFLLMFVSRYYLSDQKSEALFLIGKFEYNSQVAIWSNFSFLLGIAFYIVTICFITWKLTATRTDQVLTDGHQDV